MSRRTESARFGRTSLALLGWMLAAWPAVAVGQEAPAPPSTAPPASVPPSLSQELLERLGKVEERLDQVTQQNEALRRENQTLSEQMGALPSGSMDGQLGSTGDGSERGAASTGGGRSLSRAAGGDPTAVGQAQEVGNLHLGRVQVNAYYDFDNTGFHLDTPDKEFTFGVAGMTQLDGMVYARPTPGIETSSGFYNPRSRIYFEGHATPPISWEFSFQNFYDVVALLDAYVNFNYDSRFQVQIGRFKNPFSYEFYRIHIWDLMAPERSLFANNYEANRRFGLMAHGVLLDERVEYALGSFDTQRNGFRPFNSRQDFEASLNFKPFYPREEGFLLRNLQFGGSVDLGNENQPPSPDVLRLNRSPGADPITSTTSGSAATVPFLAFGPNVIERGTRDLWEAHLAYYYEGLSLVATLDGGHESYANGPTGAPVHVPVDGWFVQAGYLVTGETIRDRTNIQPLHPFDLRQGRFGLGAWEPTARFSQFDIDSRVFSAGLADPALWTNHVKMVDVGANWYLNQFIKVYFDWEHGIFGSPVVTTTGQFRESSDLFWIRTQLFF